MARFIGGLLGVIIIFIVPVFLLGLTRKKAAIWITVAVVGFLITFGDIKQGNMPAARFMLIAMAGGITGAIVQAIFCRKKENIEPDSSKKLEKCKDKKVNKWDALDLHSPSNDQEKSE